MATAAYPSAILRHATGHHLGSGYDEHSQPPVNNWDEEVLPAVKRQMEAERGHAGMWQQQPPPQQPARPRPTPKRSMRNDEIIQDGLGNDELIPSEWATGSHARFVTASSSYSRRQTQEDDSGYHHSTRATQPTNEWGGADSSGSPLSLSISQAREKARRLARERGEPEVLQPLHNGSEEDIAPVSSQRMRTISTPLQPTSHDTDMHNVAQRADSRDGRITPTSSRIPLPASGSMSKFVGGTSPPTTGGTAPLRNAKSAALLSSKEAATRAPPAAGRHSTPNKAASTQRPAAGKSYGVLQQRSPQATTTPQDVLDEFGPLGGSPRHPRGVAGVDEFGTVVGDGSRSASNPWDEELLPTVKRRLAQQAMAEKDPRFSHVDGLIDTWDRFGNPLSTRTVSAQRREAEAAGEKTTSTEQQDSGNDVQQTHSPKERALSPEDEQQDRLRRLTQQLDMGFQGDGSGAAQQKKESPMPSLVGSPRQPPDATAIGHEQAQASLRKRPSRRQQRPPPPPQQQQQHGGEAYEMSASAQQQQAAYTTAQIQQQTRARRPNDAKPTAAAIPQSDERVSGGCKCIIM